MFLGLVQGIAEFLPISSSGHLSIFQNFFGVDTAQDNKLFDVLLHLGTLVSVCVVYRRDIADMFLSLFGKRSSQKRGGHQEQTESPKASRWLFFMLIVATLPLMLVLPLHNKIDALFGNTYVVGGALIFTGLLLFLSDKIVQGRKTEKNMRLSDALIIGVSQAVATIPGLSRSGTTISTGMVTGLNREFAVRFAFLLSIPAVLGANAVTLYQALKEGQQLSPVYLAGMAVAMIVGYFAISFVRSLAKKGKFGSFAFYCWVVGALTIIATLFTR